MTWGRGSTRATRALRDRVLADQPTCYLRFDCCTIVATQDDHVVPLSEGGSDDRANHAAACKPCHDRKSRQEAARARRRNAVRAHHPRERHPGLT